MCPRHSSRWLESIHLLDRNILLLRTYILVENEHTKGKVRTCPEAGVAGSSLGCSCEETSHHVRPVHWGLGVAAFLCMSLLSPVYSGVDFIHISCLPSSSQRLISLLPPQLSHFRKASNLPLSSSTSVALLLLLIVMTTITWFTFVLSDFLLFILFYSIFSITLLSWHYNFYLTGEKTETGKNTQTVKSRLGTFIVICQIQQYTLYPRIYKEILPFLEKNVLPQLKRTWFLRRCS